MPSLDQSLAWLMLKKHQRQTAGKAQGDGARPALGPLAAIAPSLCARGWVRRAADLTRARTLQPVKLQEADRCADLILARWPDLRRTIAP